MKIIPNRQEPNEEFDDYFENEINKDPVISDVAKSYQEIDEAIRMTFNAETVEDDDVSEIKALKLTQLTSGQFNNFMFYYYSEMNKYIF